MTQQKTFKRRVRARMAKTGESYTAARRQLLTDAPPPFEPPVSEERVVENTGHGWDHWLAVLDEWGARGRTHTEIARFLMDDRGRGRLVRPVDHRGLRARPRHAGSRARTRTGS